MSVVALIPTIEGREESLSRTLASYEEFSPDVAIKVVTGYTGTGPCWNEWLPKLADEYDYIHCGIDDATVTRNWVDVAVSVWEDWNAMPCPLIIREPHKIIESHGVYGESFAEVRQVAWCGLPFLRADIARKIGPYIPPIHFFSDNSIARLLERENVNIYAIPTYIMGHWLESGGSNGVPGKWDHDENIYNQWLAEGMPIQR